MVEALTVAGAEVIEVPVYRWEPPADLGPLDRLTDATLAGDLDVLAFTSAPAAAGLLARAAERGLRDELIARLRGPVLALCVGPVTAAPLEAVDIPTVQPQRSRLGAMVRRLETEMPARSRGLPVAGHWLELRGHAVLVDGVLRPVPRPGWRCCARWPAAPGRVVTRGELVAALPGPADDGRAGEGDDRPARGARPGRSWCSPSSTSGYRLALDPAAGPVRSGATACTGTPGDRRRARPCCSSRTAPGTRRAPWSPSGWPPGSARRSGCRWPSATSTCAARRRPTRSPSCPAGASRCRCSWPPATTCGSTCPRSCARTGRGDVLVAETFGPDPLLVAAAVQRLRRGRGRARGDAVVLAVIGSDRPAGAGRQRAGRPPARPRAGPAGHAGHHRDGRAAGARRGGPAARRGRDRVAVASWLLAPGLFHRQLAHAGADVVAEPLADHDAVLELIAQRYSAALSAGSRTA